jgi:hypothetical protein
MSRGLIFWIIMLLWFLAIVGALLVPEYNKYLVPGGSVMLFILIALLGWDVYGPAIRGPKQP